MNMVEEIIALAAQLPSGLDDPKAAEKLLAEQRELVEALNADDYVGALTEAADAVYYACKHLQWVCKQVELPVETLFAVARAKYRLRAAPGNPKDDRAERAACAEMVKWYVTDALADND